MKIFSKGNKAFANKILGKLFFLLHSKRLIVLDAYTSFHLEHFKRIVQLLSAMDIVDIIIIGPVDNDMSRLRNVFFCQTIDLFPLYRKADIYISSELGRIPYWFDCPFVYFGHGMGPKLKYVANENLHKYDFVFSPSRPTFEIQKKIIPENRVFPLGMPILDDRTSKREEIIEYFNLDESKPILVYAPSWCKDISKVSDIEQILIFLMKKNNFNVIVSPHPFLFEPKYCNRKDFFLPELTNGLIINPPDSDFSTLEIVKVCQSVISDISSIMFEAMALDKVVFFDGNKKIYEYSAALTIYQAIIDVCYLPNWSDENDTIIEKSIANDKLAKKRKVFINEYLFNNGNASDKFIDKVFNIIGLD